MGGARDVGHEGERRGALAGSCVLFAVLMLAPMSMAQSAPAPSPAFPDKPGDWVGSLTLGGQLQSGLTRTRGYSLDGSFGYMNRRNQTFRVDLSGQYAQFRSLETDEELETVEDTRHASLTFLQPLNDRFSLVEVAQYQHNLAHQLDHRSMLSTGIAWHAIEGPRVQLLIIPGFNIGKQSSDLEHAPDSITALGAYQMLRVSITPTFTFDQSLMAFQDVEDSDFSSAVISSALTAGITQHLGLSVTYDFTYEGIRPEDAPSSQSTLSLGIRFSL